jgi:uncharacterized protein YggE
MLHLKAFLLCMALLLAFAMPSSAAGNDNASKLICKGEGKAVAVPDIVAITLGVETRNASASAAAAENAMLMNSTVNALLSAGVDKKDILASRYSLATQTEDRPVDSTGAENQNAPPVFVATNQVTARMNVSEGIGKVLDAAYAAGSNNVVGISFELRDEKPYVDQALADAIRDASRKAEVMASEAGVKLGKILEVSESYSFTSSSAPMAAYKVEAATTPILPGEIEVSASVTMTYEITKPA